MVSPNGLEIVYVGRPTRWGNWYIVGINAADSFDAVTKFKSSLEEGSSWSEMHKWAIQANLKGKNLACWCPLDQPCHADVLLEIANS